MNQTDKDFLRAVMHERMTLHYAAAHQKNSSSVQRFAALEEELNKVLSSLTEEQSEVVHQYMEHIPAQQLSVAMNSSASASM